jgi:D-3-phosphoglycerate dehydrogenase
MTQNFRALITTVPFGEENILPRTMLDAAGIDYLVNPLNRRLKEDELADMVGDFEVLIAGTEPITDKVMSRAKRLKLISRVGIGLDSVDLLAAERRGIKVSYTPDAPAPAVAELTMGLILSLLRSIPIADRRIRAGQWKRESGRRIGECTVGIIGVGRIGTRVLRHLEGFRPRAVLLNDVAPRPMALPASVKWATKEEIYANADVITLHLPLSPHTRMLIGREQLLSMKPDAVLINTSRGGIIDEAALAAVLTEGRLAGAGIDVFEVEPYYGELARIERCVLTAHMGSMSIDCRAQMEIEATEEAVRYFTGQPLAGLVPSLEYDARRLVAVG